MSIYAHKIHYRAKMRLNYPYNQLLETRTSYYTRWLLLKTENATVMFKDIQYWVLPTSALSNKMIHSDPLESLLI